MSKNLYMESIWNDLAKFHVNINPNYYVKLPLSSIADPLATAPFAPVKVKLINTAPKSMQEMVDDTCEYWKDYDDYTEHMPVVHTSCGCLYVYNRLVLQRYGSGRVLICSHVHGCDLLDDVVKALLPRLRRDGMSVHVGRIGYNRGWEIDWDLTVESLWP